MDVNFGIQFGLWATTDWSCDRCGNHNRVFRTASPGSPQRWAGKKRERKRREGEMGQKEPEFVCDFQDFSNLNNWRSEKEKKRKRKEGKERRGEIWKIKNRVFAKIIFWFLRKNARWLDAWWHDDAKIKITKESNFGENPGMLQPTPLTRDLAPRSTLPLGGEERG